MPAHTLRTVEGLGFQQLDPLPTEAEVQRFFEDEYYEMIRRGERGVDIQRSLEGGDPARRQAEWMAHTVHRDFADAIRTHAAGTRVLEVGCGLGELLDFLRAEGFDAEGLDPAATAIDAVRARGITAHLGHFEALAEGALAAERYDAILFPSVAEMFRDPVRAFRCAHDLLVPGGIVIVRCGNDGNPLQRAAVDHLGAPEWWVAVPDHLNYFTFESMRCVLTAAGLDVVHEQGDFPMELWLLLGFDYLSDRALGKECHERRVRFEMTVPVELRRRIYTALASAGVGRTMFVVARRPG
jgi:SAM-dependent methyltransferase